MGVLNQSAESFDLTVRDIAKRIDVSIWVETERPPQHLNELTRKNNLQEILAKRLIDEIMDIRSPKPSSVSIRRAIQDVLGCKVSVRRKPLFFPEGHQLAYFYDVEFATYMHRCIGGVKPRKYIPEVIVKSCNVGIDSKVENGASSAWDMWFEQSDGTNRWYMTIYLFRK